jgi:hypothetical protein
VGRATGRSAALHHCEITSDRAEYRCELTGLRAGDQVKNAREHPNINGLYSATPTAGIDEIDQHVARAGDGASVRRLEGEADVTGGVAQGRERALRDGEFPLIVLFQRAKRVVTDPHLTRGRRLQPGQCRHRAGGIGHDGRGPFPHALDA